MRMVKYLLANQLDYSWGISTSTVGLQEVPPGAEYPYGEHLNYYMFSTKKGRILLNEIHILYLLKGGGFFISAHCPKTRVQAGDVVFLFPSEWHNYAPDEDTGWEEVWIGFSSDYAQRIINEQFVTVSHPILKIGVRESFRNVFEQAYKVAHDERPGYQQQLAGYVLLILGSIYAYSKQAPYKDKPDADYIHHAQKYMREHTSENLSMEDVAKHIGMGYSKFRKFFRNYTGFSPNQYFLNLKLEKSKDLLLNTSLSSKEIAYELGFDSATYFNRIFRLHYHQTPIQYRNSVGFHPTFSLHGND